MRKILAKVVAPLAFTICYGSMEEKTFSSL